MVLVSFTVGTYHICLQLYHSLRPLPTTASKIYFALSFGFLIMRTAGVCISAANIHDEAAACKYALFAVPPQEYCDDVERFIFQVCNDHVAISGFNFFIITRRTLLTIIGLAITYEVVMFQVNTMAEDEDEGKHIKNTTLNLPT
ncbi:gustatory receptor for sugar taste 64f-like [Homalodisca vitripennis]|nr:gustatory receptor for sugar taste 64f-like [Homalodisca vitripennis]